ncbi:hypothetical protein APHACPA_1287 [Rickettsia amblyommatis str. Ac/Pa]|uniref:Uncharacterized protein n=1 Tax=Rickettsia amblyommatis str. Ac/Pa TaxID=1359164 RepID=A0A0F3N3C3_RICAM|nr:hypothetical protein APHACPA_1287 [Rickettsia amblyommatis str. Ac/Pa]
MMLLAWCLMSFPPPREFRKSSLNPDLNNYTLINKINL